MNSRLLPTKQQFKFRLSVELPTEMRLHPVQDEELILKYQKYSDCGFWVSPEGSSTPWRTMGTWIEGSCTSDAISILKSQLEADGLKFSGITHHDGQIRSLKDSYLTWQFIHEYPYDLHTGSVKSNA